MKKIVCALALAGLMGTGCDRVSRAVGVLLEEPQQQQQMPGAYADPSQPGFDPTMQQGMGMQQGMPQGMGQQGMPQRMGQQGMMGDPNGQQMPPQGGTTSVQIFDKGLNVVRSTVQLPAGWRAHHDIVTNPQNGQPQKYVLDYYGPQGELIRATGATNYFGPMGQRFDKMWPQVVRQAMNGVGTDLKIGNRRATELIQRLPNINKVLGNVNKDAFEAPFTATREGRQMAGVAYVLHIPASPDSGTFVLNVVVAPTEHLASAVEAGWAIGASEQINPEFTQVQNSISQRVMAQSQRDHQARMRSNQQAFDAHQARMRSNSQAFDQANAAWLNNFRGGGGTGGNGYDSHDAFIDSIHESQTFNDPSTGQNVRRDGQYQYNYTDGQGNFYGTDNPSFDPASLDGDWQATEPLEP